MRETIGSIALIIQLGAMVVVVTILPLLIGIWLDRRLNTSPWITLLSLGVGIFAAVTAVYNIISSNYKKLS